MPDNDYAFDSRWEVPGLVADVAEVLFDPMTLPEWWPSVYRTVDRVDGSPPDAPPAVGSAYDLHTTGWLPYTLRWRLTVESVGRDTCSLTASGDLVGRGVWRLRQLTPTSTEVRFDWRVRADKPLLRDLSTLVKPVFAANHQWAMRQGDRSLRLAIARRSATLNGDVAALAAIPAPPPPTGAREAALLAAGALVAIVPVAWLCSRRAHVRAGLPAHPHLTAGAHPRRPGGAGTRVG
ncbi:hypothetical protein [Actinoalloteichus caeruleus]|uniref:hypothetical protein n=1 Tax=Actinoalloteichus cyanogriseus TaxID=2893586 RepID=UPI003AAF719B